MAPRNRQRVIGYGGELCGVLNGTDKFVPYHVGIHSCVDETHPGPPYKSGGPLSISKKRVSICRTTRYFARRTSAPQQQWDGFLSVNAYIPSPEPTPTHLAGWGAKGWNLTSPLHPIMSLGVALAEVREVPRMLKQTRDFLYWLRGLRFARFPQSIKDFVRRTSRGTKNLAGNYLNLQFGWVPFINDLYDIFTMRIKLEKKIAWLRSKNRKSVRRRIELDSGGFSEDIPRNVPPHTTMSPLLPTLFYTGSVVTSYPIPVQKVFKRKIWYVAKYQFYIPELADPNSRLLKLKLDLSGLSLDPSVLYQAIPWSWLIDWFTSVGDILQNISTRMAYHVVARYAYVMCDESFTYEAPGYVNVNVGTRGSLPVWSLGSRYLQGVSRTIYEFKNREVANPYGFGITFSSLSAYQWSILAALGLSGRKRAPRA